MIDAVTLYEFASSSQLYRRMWEYSKCSQPDADPDDWFPPEPKPNQPTTGHTRSIYERYARNLCAGCPVTGECLELALREESSIPLKHLSGIRGGLAPWERARLLASRRSAWREGAA